MTKECPREMPGGISGVGVRSANRITRVYLQRNTLARAHRQLCANSWANWAKCVQ